MSLNHGRHFNFVHEFDQMYLFKVKYYAKDHHHPNPLFILVQNAKQIENI